MKLHRRVVRLRGRDHTVITLRPDSRARFSTNNFDGNWNILSDLHGARVLGRLLWGLSYQARPGTLVLIDEPRLDTNPFDAEPAQLIALIPEGLTGETPGLMAELRRSRARRAAPTGTVRWQTPGLDLAVAQMPHWHQGPHVAVEVVRSVSGVLTVALSPGSMRTLAVLSHWMHEWWVCGHSILPIDWRDGRIQILRDYHRRVSIARQARAEVLARPDTVGLSPVDLRPLIWRHSNCVRRRRNVTLNSQAA